MLTFCEAIARKEGWLVEDSRCRRNHNPGNIEWGSFAAEHGANGGDPRFAVFPDDGAGFSCMAALLSRKYLGLSVAQAISKWAPENENDTPKYIADVCEWTGLTGATVLTVDMMTPN